MLSMPRRQPWRLILVALLMVGVTPARSGALVGLQASAFDYLQIKGLSKVRYDYATEVTRTPVRLDM